MSMLTGRTAIVTGSSSGIGQGIAERLAQEGANVVIDYVGSPDGAEVTLKKIQASGAKGVMVEADVSQVSAVRSLVNEAWQAFGGADILVNNAGVEKEAPFWEATEQEYDLVLGVNLKGPFFLTQAFAQRLIEAKKPGRVINISSVHEDMAFPNFATYCASKGGLRMLMRDLAVELGPLGITVNNVAPGAIETPINAEMMSNPAQLEPLLRNIPLGRMGKSDEVAGLAAFLASDEAAYVTGSTYFMDGGLIRNYHEQ